jgi:hypothetical protein
MELLRRTAMNAKDTSSIGIYIITKLHDLTSDMDSERAFNVRFNFYASLVASDIVSSVEKEHSTEIVQVFADHMLEILEKFYAKGGNIH